MTKLSRRPLRTALALVALLGTWACGDKEGVDNLPPQAFDATVTGFKNTPISVEVRGVDGDGGSVTVRIVSGPDHGTLSAITGGGSGGGTVTYTPDPGFVGTDRFVYEVSDGEATATGTITIIIENRLPTADDATANGIAGGTIEVTLSGQDPDGDALTFLVDAAPSNGTLSAVTSTGATTATVTYTPDAGFDGMDEFTYVASDGDGQSAPATVTIVVGVGATANPQSVTTEEDRAVNIQLSADNPVGGDVTFRVIDGPAHGELTNPVFAPAQSLRAPATAAITYIPDDDYFGDDAFTFEVSDGVGAPSSAVVTLTVTPVNDAPSFSLGDDLVLNENSGPQSIAGFASDISAGPFESFGPGAGFSVTHDQVDFFVAQPAISLDGTLTFNTAPDAVGVATVVVDLRDGDGETAGAQVFTITSLETNAAPTFTLGPNPVVVEDSPAQSLIAWATGISGGPGEPFGPGAAFALSNDNNGIFSVQPALTLTGTLSFTPAPNAFGVATVTAVLSDGFGATTSQNFTITITPVNDAPSFTAGPDVTVDEDASAQSIAGWATAISAGAGGETFGAGAGFTVTNDNNALFTVQPAVALGGTLSFTPAPDAFGSATVTVDLADGDGASAGPQVVTITLTSVNDAPSFTAGADQTVAEDAGAQTVAGWATAISTGPANEAGQTPTFTVSNDNNALFGTQPAVSATGTLTYTPAADAFGSATVTVSLMDDGGTANGGVDTSADQTFTITVTAVNDAPSFTVGPDVTVGEDAAAQTVAGWATAISPGPGESFGAGAAFNVTNDNNALFDAQPAVALDGTLTFTPAPMATGVANVSVTLADGEGASSAPQPFVITITAINDAPSFTAGPDQTVAEDAGAQTVAGWATDISPGPADEAGQTVSFNVANDNNALFSAQPAISATGDLTYTPAADAFGSATVTVSLTDDGGTANGGVDTSADQTFTITVTAVNDPPSFTAGADVSVATSSPAYTEANWATAIDPGTGETFGAGAAFNVTNDNNALFSVQPAVALDGTLTFTPAPASGGVANVDVTLSDGDGATTAAQSFTITVNSTPVATDQTVLTDEDTPLVITLAGTDADGDALTFAIATPPSAGSLGAITQLTPTTAQVTYTPAVGQIGDRSFTFTVNDGTTDSAPGTVTLTVNDVPETVAVAGVGNTQIATAGLATAPTTPAVTLAGGVLAGTPTLTIQSPGTPIATTQGGSVTLEADGDFLYTPPTGYTGADDFDYTVTTGRTATVNVTVSGSVWYVDNSAGGGGTGRSHQPFNTLAGASAAAGAGEIIFVDRGTGTTTGMSSGITLAANQQLIGEPAGLTVAAIEVVAANAAAPRPQITNGVGAAVTMGAGSTVAGVDLASPSGAGIQSSASGGTVTDVTIDTPGGAGVSLSGATGSFTMTGLDVNNAVGNGIAVDGGSATVDITLTSGSLDNAAGNAVRVENTTGGSVTIGGGPINETGAGLYLDNNVGSVTVNSVVTVTNPSSTGVFYQNSSGSAAFADLTVTTTGQIGIQAVNNSGTFTVTTGSVSATNNTAVVLSLTPLDVSFTSVTKSGLSNGVILSTTAGTADLGTVSITNSSGVVLGGAGLVLSNAGTVGIGAGSSVATTNGPAIYIANTTVNDGGAGAMTFTSATSTNSGTKGIDLTNVSGDLVVNGGSITGSATQAFDVAGGSGNVTYAGTITNAANNAVEITGRTGGTVTLGGTITDTGTGILVENNTGGSSTFSGASKSVSTGTNGAVRLLSNTGHTVNFTNGGLDIDATSGNGFFATGGGTVTVQGSGNSVTTTTGIAVGMTSTAVGASGVTFESVSANGTSNGIVLVSTSAGGGTFSVTGTGSTDGSGGTIQNTTGSGVSLQSANNVSLANMIIGDGTATAGQAPDGTNNIAGDGITVINSDNLTLNNVFIARTGSDGIDGTGVTGATFTDVTILNAGDGNDEHGIAFDGVGANNLDGTVVMTDVVVDGAFNTGVFVQNSSGTLDLTFQGTSVSACRIANTTGASFGDDGMLLDARGSTSMTVVVNQCTFEDLESDGIAALAQEGGGATLDFTVSNSTFTGCAAGVCSATGSDNALSIRTGGSATLDFDVTGNQLGANNQTVIVQGNNTSVLRGTVDGNTIGTGALDSGSRTGRGVDIFADDDSQLTIQVSNNTVRNTDFEGIYAFANDGGGLQPTLNATITGNVVATPDDNSAFPLGVPSIEVTGRNVAVVCTDIRNNTVSAGTGGFDAIRIRQRETSTHSVERLTLGTQTAATTDTHVTSENPGAAGVTATADVGFTGVADGTCPTPP